VRRLAKLEEDARRQQEAAAAAAQRAANAEGKAEVLQKALQKAEERAATLEMQARARAPAPASRRTRQAHATWPIAASPSLQPGMPQQPTPCSEPRLVSGWDGTGRAGC
jgi:hypothetical protein